MAIPFIEENDQTRARHEHLTALRRLVGNAYPNKFERSQTIEAAHDDTITAIVEKFRAFEPKLPGGKRQLTTGHIRYAAPPEEVELANQQLNKITVRLAGRIATPPRVMGKVAFVHLSDGGAPLSDGRAARLQIYVRRGDFKAVHNDSRHLIEDEMVGWEVFGLLDHGDFIGVDGYLFITKTGELSVHVQSLQFLAKALMPMPDKMQGINDPEIRQRQRYADLIAGSLKVKLDEEEEEEEEEEEDEEGEVRSKPVRSELETLTTRQVFERRAAIIREFRRILDDHGYIEVETPMLTPLATGAAAKPFKTHHNALDIDLYARIAPELYLKRLLVGGFEKVYELNRNFRNEGISTRHNPEFTMLEFYWAYADVNQMIDFCEEMLRATVYKALGHTHVRFGDLDIDFSQPFARLTMKESVAAYSDNITDDNVLELFEQHVEHKLVQPTFIYNYPKPISPLSKASPSDPNIAERFELFIAGMECANGFSELNDPEEQYQRFKEQMQQRERGDDEAMVMDEDYIRALSYGMPPAAGIGIGIDRFTMLVTNRQSIRDVILFPHMRPERKREEAEAESE